MLVKIDRSTIKRNPNAGSMTTNVVLGAETRLTIKTSKDLPDWLKDESKFLLYSHGPVDEATIEYNFYVLVEPADIIEPLRDHFKKLRGSSFSLQQEIKRDSIHHMPLPEFLYEYEDPLTECGNCEALVPVSKIIQGSDEFEDVSYDYKKCPECGYIDCFEEIEYEKFDESMLQQS